MSENRSVAVILRAEVGSYVAGMRAAATETRTLATQISATGTAKQKQGLADISRGALAVGAAAAFGIGVAINKFAEFDHQMSAVQAATHESAGAMDQLRAAALQAGQDTVFSATEAAAAEEALAKAGVATRDILGGGLKGALSLAAAGNLEVADSAEIAATAMTQFELAGRDIPHIADLLAAGAGKAQGEVSDLAEALKFVGPVAHGMGVSIEETTGVLALFAKQGIIGEQAGTGLRGVLLSLTSPSKQASAEMERLGITLYDANGQFVGLDGVAGQLRTAFKDLSPAARDAALGVIFGNQQVTAARVLYSGGAEAVQKWTDKVNDQGYAAETAALKMDNLKGDIEQLSGSLETALIQSGSSANGVLRGLTKTATALINDFGALPAPLQATATGLVAVSAAVLLVGGSIGLLGPKIANARLALVGLGTAGVQANRALGGLGKLGAYGAIAATAAVGFSALQDQIDKLTGNTPPKVDALTRSLLKLADEGKVSGELSGLFGDDLEDLGHSVDEATSNIGGFQRALESLAKPFGGSGSDLEKIDESLYAIDQALTGLVESGHADAAAAIFAELSERVRLGGGEVDNFKDAMGGYTNAVANANSETKLAADGQGELTAGLDESKTAADAAADAIQGYKDELDGLNNKAIDAYQSQTDLKRSFVDLTKATRTAGRVTLDERDSLAAYAKQSILTAQAIVDQTGDTDKANASLATARRRFIDAAESAGYTARQARKLADDFFAIPAAVSTTVKAPGLASALARIADLRWQIDHIPRSVTIGVFNKVHNIPAPGSADGGIIRGPGTGTSDSIPIYVSNGEYVMRAAAVDRIGVHNLDRMNRGFANGGQVRDGGPVWASRIPLPAAAASSRYDRPRAEFSFTVHEAPHFNMHEAMQLVAMAESLINF